MTASADGEPRGTRLAKLGAATGVLGFLISLGALYLSYVVHHEDTKVDLQAVASTDPFGSTPAGYAVRVSLSNESLRPVIVRSMTLTMGGEPVAPVTSFLPNEGAKTDAVSLGDEPLEDAHSLPLALPARGAMTLTAFADFSRAAEQALQKERTPRLKRALEFCHRLPREGERPPPTDGQLEVDAEPGGTLKVPVTVSLPIRGANIWRMDVTGPVDHPNGLVFWRRVAAPSALRLLTAKVWTWDGHPERSASLPVTGAAYSEVRFPGLQAGESYRAALLDGHEPLAVGKFHVPLDEEDEVIYPSPAQTVNGECLRVEGKHDVYDYPHTPYAHGGE